MDLIWIFCGSFVLFMSFVFHAFGSVHCCLVFTFWERLLALVCDVQLCFVTLSCGILGQEWCLVVLNSCSLLPLLLCMFCYVHYYNVVSFVFAALFVIAALFVSVALFLFAALFMPLENRTCADTVILLHLASYIYRAMLR